MANVRPAAALPVAVGRYAMSAQIGAGGMATVHLGRGPREDGTAPGSSGRVVAIKRLRPHFVIEPDVVSSFLDEARLSARVRHPNVVATLDAVTHEGEVFIVMEYVEGVSLSSLIRAQAALPGKPAVPAGVATAILVDVLRGLHAAHEAVNEAGAPLHMVHRDVSPHNILVGTDGVARVLDFGIAKALGRQQTTRDGKIKGKLGYMAPEQLSGRGATRRTDLFAAGIVLWELLSGDHLFRADDEATTVARVLMDPVRAPSTVRAEAPAALDGVVLRALERDPTKRFFSADEMASALEAAVTPAGAATVGEWVRALAAEELARRARLLREETENGLTFAPSGEGGANATATHRDVPPTGARLGGRGRTARAALAATALVGAGLAVWGVSSARGKVPVAPSMASALSVAPTPPPPPPDEKQSALPSPPTTVGEVAPPASPASAAPSSKATSRHSVTKPTAPKGAPNVRARLYSRD